MIAAILTLNAGSSSLKLSLYAAEEDRLLASLVVDRIGEAGALRLKDGAGMELASLRLTDEIRDHSRALATALTQLAKAMPEITVTAVGHRVVHGGPLHASPLLLSAAEVARLASFEPLAPLHQPHNLAGIRAAFAAFPGATQVACFDTAFHRAQPFMNDVFALPREFYEKGVRRYGFHGLSYEYVSGELKRRAPLLADGRVVVAHLGNGASMCAILGGRSVASTMGFSALDGLPMGTRCGQLDPGVVLYLMEHEGMDAKAISDLLYKRSGLLGLSGISHDMRTLEAAATPEADQAIGYFVFRIQREIGAMAAALGGIDALVFCGGIGENSRLVRARVCERLGWMGIEIDAGRNAENAEVISSDLGRTSVLVIPTNEELVIARATRRLALDSARSAA